MCVGENFLRLDLDPCGSTAVGHHSPLVLDHFHEHLSHFDFNFRLHSLQGSSTPLES